MGTSAILSAKWKRHTYSCSSNALLTPFSYICIHADCWWRTFKSIQWSLKENMSITMTFCTLNQKYNFVVMISIIRIIYYSFYFFPTSSCTEASKTSLLGLIDASLILGSVVKGRPFTLSHLWLFFSSHTSRAFSPDTKVLPSHQISLGLSSWVQRMLPHH